jgi:DNA polymerase-1
MGTVTGRTSCKRPNAQQIPRDEAEGRTIYRTCFRAPPGRVLVKCDYSTLQMRIAAKVSGDAELLRVFQGDGDTHTAIGRALLGKEQVTKQERQIAKSANFCLIFGGSADALRVYCKTTFGLTLGKEEAERHRAAFFHNYAGLARWHRRTQGQKPVETRSTLGRRRLMHPATPFTEMLNSPVQGDEADGAKLALAVLWERRAECPGAFPVLFCHDEMCCGSGRRSG